MLFSTTVSHATTTIPLPPVGRYRVRRPRQPFFIATEVLKRLRRKEFLTVSSRMTERL